MHLNDLLKAVCLFLLVSACACKTSQNEVSDTMSKNQNSESAQSKEEKGNSLSECLAGTWGISATENASFQLDAGYLYYPDAEDPYLYRIDGTILLCHSENGDTVFIRNVVSCNRDSLIMLDHQTRDTMKMRIMG